MSITKSKHFTKSQLSEESSLGSSLSDFDRDDDDPLSFRRLSIISLGITIAFLAVILPSISVFLGRPFSQGNELIQNHSINKDGS